MGSCAHGLTGCLERLLGNIDGDTLVGILFDHLLIQRTCSSHASDGIAAVFGPLLPRDGARHVLVPHAVDHVTVALEHMVLHQIIVFFVLNWINLSNWLRFHQLRIVVLNHVP